MSGIKIQLILVYEGKVLHLLCCLHQSQTVQVFQNLTRTQHVELQNFKKTIYIYIYVSIQQKLSNTRPCFEE